MFFKIECGPVRVLLTFKSFSKKKIGILIVGKMCVVSFLALVKRQKTQRHALGTDHLEIPFCDVRAFNSTYLRRCLSFSASNEVTISIAYV